MAMPVDFDKLIRLQIPVVRQMIMPTDIALYGLSVGMGHDPMNQDELAFVDPLQGPKVNPAMVLVMAHPGFYLGHSESGVDPASVLHAEQSIDILGAIPSSGEVSSQTRITDVVDKGAGKAALIFAQTELTDATNRVFARLNRTTFIRGGGGFGGKASPANPVAPHVMPEEPPMTVINLDTRPEQALLYRLNGDLNPLHSDPELARKLGFERPILHGLCTMGVVCHAVLRALADYRAEALQSIRLRFSKPVYPGETIQTQLWRDGSFRAVVPTRGAIVIEGGFAVIDRPK